MHQQGAHVLSTSGSIELAEFAEHVHAAMSCCGARVRVEILAHLCCAPMTVRALARALTLDEPLVSKYLKTLHSRGFLEMRRMQKFHEYRLSEQVRVQSTAEGIEIWLPVQDAPAFKLVFPKAMLTRLLAEHPRSGHTPLAPSETAPLPNVTIVRPRPGDPPGASGDDAARAQRPGEH